MDKYGLKNREEVLEAMEVLERSGLKPHIMMPDGSLVSFFRAQEEVREAWIEGWEFSNECSEKTKLLRTRLEEMDLSRRAKSVLTGAQVKTVGDLIGFRKNDVLKFRNAGRVTADELDRLVKSLGLKWDTDAKALIVEEMMEWKRLRAASPRSTTSGDACVAKRSKKV